MRNISFMLTTQQIRDRTKTVTRRLKWLNVKVGDRLQGCEKCQGRKAGEPLVKLAVVEVVSVRRESLDAIDQADVIREGFPNLTPAEFVQMFCDNMKCDHFVLVTRIEFKYVDA